MSDFEAFAVDPANRPAVEAAAAIADAERPPYAPLVVIGSKGSGKTELLLAIAERARTRHPGRRIEFLDPGVLAERFREASLANRGGDYRDRLAEADMLLLDDLETLPRHRECQGLLADLFDARRGAGRETVVASSAEIGAVEGLDPRVARRLQQGSEVRLAFPTAAARLALLRQREGAGIGALSEEVLHAVAEAEFPSLRDYFGALSRLLAFQEASPVPLSAQDALLLIGAPAGALPGPTAAPPLPPPPEDEFNAFLSEVADELSEQIDRWRERIGQAVLRWSAEGLRTRRLEALLATEIPADPEPTLRAYEAAAREIVSLAAEAGAISPDLAGAEAFRDPDQLAAARVLVEEARSRAPLSAPLPHYRWEDFAEGPASRLSVRAGRDIIMEPGHRYSPLLVTGGPGSGKSHFLHGLGNALTGRGIGPVVCLAGPAFAAEVRALADAAATDDWRRRYRWVGAFLLDDLHLLAGEVRAQQELAALVAELLEGRRQMVFASLRPLDHFAGLDVRLVSLLQSGLTVELPPPDREVRLAVIRKLLAESPAADDAALLDYLAARPAESVRGVQGMVQRVLSAAAAQQIPPSPQLAREVLELGPSVPHRTRSPGAGGRVSGILAPGAGLVRSGEKMVKHWPTITDRLIAELR